jgi:hypothetical protein
MGNLQVPGKVTIPTQWRLLPSPQPANVKLLEHDEDPGWISYRTPYSAQSYRRAQSYMNFVIPVKRGSLNIVDQWVTPNWHDHKLPDGAVWTNEMIHFVLDNCMPLLNDLMGSGRAQSLYEMVVEAGMAQKAARKAGRNDKIWGDGLDDPGLFPYIISTMTIATEIKKLLPEDGVKWLFMRVTVKSLKNDRMDYDIDMLDEYGDLVATSHQLVQVISIESKKPKKAVL